MLDSPVRVYWPTPTFTPPRKSGRFFANFQRCPHCEALGRRWEIDRLTETVPIISRSDGENFHLLLGDRPIAYPATDGRRIVRMSAGFWFVRERNRIFGEMSEFPAPDGHPPSRGRGTWARTEATVVLFHPKWQRTVLLRQIETIADRLAELLEKSEFLENLYEFEGDRLHRHL